MSLANRIEAISRVAWQAILEERAADATANNDTPAKPIAWGTLTVEERESITQPVGWMIDALYAAVDSLYQARAREAFLSAVPQSPEQE